MVKRGEKTSNKGLMAALCILMVLIVGLSISIAVISLQNENSIANEPENTTEEESAENYMGLPDNPYKEGSSEYYNFLINKIIEEDTERLRGEEAIGYALMLDEAEKSIESAGLVIWVANIYGMEDTVNKYFKVYEERMTESNNGYVDGGIG